jgi:hypothetical protein
VFYQPGASAPALLTRVVCDPIPGASRPETQYGWPSRADSAQSLLDRKGTRMDVLIGVLITFLVVILVLYLVNMLPIDGRAKQIVRVIVIILGVISLLKYLAVF